MGEIALLYHYLIVGAALVGLGAVGFVSRRNMIIMFLSAEMMLQGIALSLVAWGRYHGNLSGQMLVIFIIAVAAAEAAIALALVLMAFRHRGTLDILTLQDLREAGIAPYTDRRIPSEDETPTRWPRLPQAGRRPQVPSELTDYRRDL